MIWISENIMQDLKLIKASFLGIRKNLKPYWGQYNACLFAFQRTVARKLNKI